MPAKAKPHGTRVYFYDDGVILIKQTVKNTSGRYVIDVDSNGEHREGHVDPGDDRYLAEVIRLAGQGRL